MKKWLHAIIHWFDFHSTFVDTYVENEYVYTGHRCSTCGKIERVIPMWSQKDSDKYLKNLFIR